jgi:hypothetical protein
MEHYPAVSQATSVNSEDNPKLKIYSGTLYRVAVVGPDVSENASFPS